MRWFVGFAFHKITFGLLSVLLPLYITQSIRGGTLGVWGAITASATLLAIPFSFIWGYLCDTTHHYRVFILLSFSAITVVLYAFSLTTDLLLLWLLYALIALFQVAYEPPKNVLIAETYSHEEWKQGFALYATWAELGWVVGLLLGFLLAFLGFESVSLLSVSVLLSLLSFLLSLLFTREPVLMIERGLVGVERSVSLVQRGAMLLSRVDLDSRVARELQQENIYAFSAGLVLFSLATSSFFIPLPVFFARTLALQTNVIFALLLPNSGGCFLGCLLALRRAGSLNSTASVKKIPLLRSLLALLPVSAGIVPSLVGIAVSMMALMAMGFLYAFYSVAVLSISMEMIPQGKVGLPTALVGIGSAAGCFLGPLIADTCGFHCAFAVSAVCFLLSCFAFRKFASN